MMMNVIIEIEGEHTLSPNTSPSPFLLLKAIGGEISKIEDCVQKCNG